LWSSSHSLSYNSNNIPLSARPRIPHDRGGCAPRWRRSCCGAARRPRPDACRPPARCPRKAAEGVHARTHARTRGRMHNELGVHVQTRASNFCCVTQARTHARTHARMHKKLMSANGCAITRATLIPSVQTHAPYARTYASTPTNHTLSAHGSATARASHASHPRTHTRTHTHTRTSHTLPAYSCEGRARRIASAFQGRSKRRGGEVW
jgi:hypothetical protein